MTRAVQAFATLRLIADSVQVRNIIPLPMKPFLPEAEMASGRITILPTVSRGYADLPSEILRRNAEVDELRKKKIGATPQEIKKINGEIRGKSIHLSTMKRKLNSQNFSNETIGQLLELCDAEQFFWEKDSAETKDHLDKALLAVESSGIENKVAIRLAEDTYLAQMKFHDKEYEKIPPEEIQTAEAEYINKLLRDPEEVKELRETYGRS